MADPWNDIGGFLGKVMSTTGQGLEYAAAAAGQNFLQRRGLLAPFVGALLSEPYMTHQRNIASNLLSRNPALAPYAPLARGGMSLGDIAQWIRMTHPQTVQKPFPIFNQSTGAEQMYDPNAGEQIPQGYVSSSFYKPQKPAAQKSMLGVTRSFNQFLMSQAGIDMSTPEGRAAYGRLTPGQRMALLQQFNRQNRPLQEMQRRLMEERMKMLQMEQGIGSEEMKLIPGLLAPGESSTPGAPSTGDATVPNPADPSTWGG